MRGDRTGVAIDAGGIRPPLAHSFKPRYCRYWAQQQRQRNNERPVLIDEEVGNAFAALLRQRVVLSEMVKIIPN